MVFAEVGTEWLAVVSSVVNVGFSVVVGIYLLTKAIPKMQLDHSIELAAQRASFLDEMKVKRAEFLTELKNIELGYRTDDKERREEYKETLKYVIDHCEREGARRDQALQVELTSMTKTAEQQAELLEEVRDALRELRTAIMSIPHNRLPS